MEEKTCEKIRLFCQKFDTQMLQHLVEILKILISNVHRNVTENTALRTLLNFLTSKQLNI